MTVVSIEPLTDLQCYIVYSSYCICEFITYLFQNCYYELLLLNCFCYLCTHCCYCSVHNKQFRLANLAAQCLLWSAGADISMDGRVVISSLQEE